MAQERAAWLERRYGARIEWLPFELHPEYPPEGIPRGAVEARYGEGFVSHVRRMIEEAGLAYGPPPVVPNSMLSLQLGEFARDAGKLGRLHPLLFEAYWAEGRDIGRMDVLEDVAHRAGLDVEAALAVLRQRSYEARVRSLTDTALRVGVDGVPAWLIEERALVPGAQPYTIFDRILARLGFQPVEGAR